MGLRRARSLAWILPRRYFLLSSYFWSGESFEAFENALSNFASWADIFISALKGAHAIQNFDLKELRAVQRGHAEIARFLLGNGSTIQEGNNVSRPERMLSGCG